MDDNIGARDCAVRILCGLGFTLFALLVFDGSMRWVSLIGLLPVASAIFGYCPGYALLGVSTVRRPMEYASQVRRSLAR